MVRRPALPAREPGNARGSVRREQCAPVRLSHPGGGEAGFLRRWCGARTWPISGWVKPHDSEPFLVGLTFEPMRRAHVEPLAWARRHAPSPTLRYVLALSRDNEAPLCVDPFNQLIDDGRL